MGLPLTGLFVTAEMSIKPTKIRWLVDLVHVQNGGSEACRHRHRDNWEVRMRMIFGTKRTSKRWHRNRSTGNW